MKIKHLAIAITLAIGANNLAVAQETSSAIRGNVVTAAGQVAENARVDILHVPSGTRSVATTNSSGAFSSSGLRVGGPYVITITSAEGAKTYNDVFLSLGEAFRLTAQLEASQVERIAVTGAAIAGTSNNGSSSYFSADDITNSPTFNRDLKEVARMNPYVNLLPGADAPLSIGGSNPRYNSISIDGVGVNDDFGLNTNGYPTQRSPISLDAVEQVSVDVAPFDASEGGFSGGRINAVTKSGTNEFHGSFSYEKMSDSWAGTPKHPVTGDVPLDFERDTYSFALGGPIVKDQLFFFLNYEKSKEPTQVEYGPAGSGAANDSRVTSEQYDQIKEIAQRVYGVDAGEWNSASDTENENLLLKLDWNINNDHRASFTYNLTEGNNLRNQSTGNSTLQLDTNWYDYTQNMELYRFSLFSDWTVDLSSEIYFNYKDVESISALKTREFGDINVRTGTGTLNFGPDSNRHANELQNSDMKIGAKFTYLFGDHQLKFGGEYNKLDVFNIFVRNSLGTWTFDSIADFENRVASGFSYENAFTNVASDAAADFSLGMTNLYVQDNWYLNDSMELGLGLRYERYNVSDKPALNPNYVERYGFSNQENLDGLDILLPRVDFKWTATDDVTVRAGVGRFSGGKPNVWVSNSFSNDGYSLVQPKYDEIYNVHPDFTRTFNPNGSINRSTIRNADLKNIPAPILAAMYPGDGDTNSIDPNYKMPSDWIARLAVDYRFDIPGVGEDFYWNTEVMRKWMTDNSQWVDISRCVSGQTAAGVNTYEPCDADAPTGHYDLLLTNEDVDGKAWIWTTSLAKNWDSGLSVYTSYTNQDIEEGNPGTSSTATSNYRFNIVRDRNEALVGTADYEVEHSFKLTVGYSTEFFSGYASKFNLFFQRRSGTSFSWVMGMFNDYGFGDQTSSFASASSYLPYIPTGANDPNLSPESTISYDDLMANFAAVGLDQYAGGFAPKGTGKSPWVSALDFQFQQEVPGFADGHKGVIYFTVNNLLNLIDSSKGKVLRQEFTNSSIVDFAGLDSQGRYIYEPVFGGVDTNNWSIFDSEESTWRVKVGVSYKF